MTEDYWPLFGLRLRTGEVELRPMAEADALEIADLVPDDLELDPSLPGYDLPERVGRGTAMLQSYWRSYGTWRPEAWRLNFVVRSHLRIIGVQELQGTDFPLLRTVDTSSFLIPRARGKGLGQQMRRAALALAFGPLQAQAAISEAWHDNHASLGVSRALGYRPNGEALHARRNDAGVDRMAHLLLTRRDWLAANHPTVRIDGFEPCLPLFGLTDWGVNL